MEELKVSRDQSPESGSVKSGPDPRVCPSCFREMVSEAVQIRQSDRSWADSSVRRCVGCESTFGGTLEDRLAYVRDKYEYKYFGDYELSSEQLDAVWTAKGIAELVPELLEALKAVRASSEWSCMERETQDAVEAAITKAEGQPSSANQVAGDSSRDDQ